MFNISLICLKPDSSIFPDAPITNSCSGHLSPRYFMNSCKSTTKSGIKTSIDLTFDMYTSLSGANSVCCIIILLTTCVVILFINNSISATFGSIYVPLFTKNKYLIKLYYIKLQSVPSSKSIISFMSSNFKLAPPIRKPETFCATAISVAFKGLTLPP